jgi:hypothetical protein
MFALVTSQSRLHLIAASKSREDIHISAYQRIDTYFCCDVESGAMPDVDQAWGGVLVAWHLTCLL